MLSICISLCDRFPIPVGGLRQILLYAQSFRVHHAQSILCQVVPLVGGFAKPGDRLRQVLHYAIAVCVCHA